MRYKNAQLWDKKDGIMRYLIIFAGNLVHLLDNYDIIEVMGYYEIITPWKDRIMTKSQNY